MVTLWPVSSYAHPGPNTVQARDVVPSPLAVCTPPLPSPVEGEGGSSSLSASSVGLLITPQNTPRECSGVGAVIVHLGAGHERRYDPL
jgi:hypothetical protein